MKYTSYKLRLIKNRKLISNNIFTFMKICKTEEESDVFIWLLSFAKNALG
jgi:hypothetical protein